MMLNNDVPNMSPTICLLDAISTDRGFVLTIKTMRKLLKVDDLDELKENKDLLSKFIRNHVVLGRTSDTRTWRKGNILTTALDNALQMVEGLKMNLYLKGESGFDETNIPWG